MTQEGGTMNKDVIIKDGKVFVKDHNGEKKEITFSCAIGTIDSTHA